METGYGFCPHCGAAGKARERRPNGNDVCINGHIYPSSQAAKSNTPIIPKPKRENDWYPPAVYVGGFSAIINPDGVYKLYYGGTCLGDAVSLEDGYYYFADTARPVNGGVWDGYTLRGIADCLEGINLVWDKQVKTDLSSTKG